MTWQGIGRDGGDVSDADAVLLPVPGGSIAEAVENVSGLEGKTAVDATNLVGIDPPDGFASNAAFLKSKTGGPTAKSSNINFAVLYDRLGDARATPSNLWCGDDEARDVVEQLNRDAGFEPVCAPADSRTQAYRKASSGSCSRSTRVDWGRSWIAWRRPTCCRHS